MSFLFWTILLLVLLFLPKHLLSAIFGLVFFFVIGSFSSLFFSHQADWCKPCISLGKVFDELAKKYGNAKFVTVEAEKLPEISEKHKITVVPTFILWQNGQEVCRVEGAKASDLSQAVEKFSKNVSQATVAAKAAPQEKEDLTARLEKLINYAPVMLFMKGTPQAPLCGFSRQAVEILQKTG